MKNLITMASAGIALFFGWLLVALGILAAKAYVVLYLLRMFGVI